MTGDDEVMVERVARAIAAEAHCDWELDFPGIRDMYCSLARAALAAAGVREAPPTAAGALGYCMTDITVDGDSRLGCLQPAGHPPPHLAYATTPCPACWGIDSHADWCPLMGQTEPTGFDLAFSDDGAYWVVRGSDAATPGEET